MQFHETRLGSEFFNARIPKITKALERIADALERNNPPTVPEVKVKKTATNATIPTRGSDKAAGYDLYSTEETTIKSGETVVIGTGISMEIPDGYYGAVYARSGLATKQGLRPANCVGVIDSDYRGEIKVALHNDSGLDRIVNEGDRIAQLVICPYLTVSFKEVDDLNSTERGEGGFGHTGK